MDALVALLHEDATLSMPPLRPVAARPDDIARWMLGPGHGCRGSRLVPIAANGSPAFGQYRPTRAAGTSRGRCIVLEMSGRHGSPAINIFLDTDHLFPLFGLPPHLD